MYQNTPNLTDSPNSFGIRDVIFCKARLNLKQLFLLLVKVSPHPTPFFLTIECLKEYQTTNTPIWDHEVGKVQSSSASEALSAMLSLLRFLNPHVSISFSLDCART